MIAILTPFSQISCLDRSVPTSRPPTRPTQPVAAALLVSGTPTYNYIVTDQRQVAAQQLQSCTAFHHLNYVSTGAKGRARNSIHTGEKRFNDFEGLNRCFIWFISIWQNPSNSLFLVLDICGQLGRCGDGGAGGA